MLRRIIAVMLALALPATASAGPLKDAIEKGGRELAARSQEETPRNRARFWTGIALVAGGGTLVALSAVEIGDDEQGPDDGEDLDGSDDGEDKDGWGNKAVIGGGIAAAAAGGWLLLTGRRDSGPRVSVRPGHIAVRHTVRF
jgi:hypothetical protein